MELLGAERAAAPTVGRTYAGPRSKRFRRESTGLVALLAKEARSPGQRDGAVPVVPVSPPSPSLLRTPVRIQERKSSGSASSEECSSVAKARRGTGILKFSTLARFEERCSPATAKPTVEAPVNAEQGQPHKAETRELAPVLQRPGKQASRKRNSRVAEECPTFDVSTLQGWLSYRRAQATSMIKGAPKLSGDSVSPGSVKYIVSGNKLENTISDATTKMDKGSVPLSEPSVAATRKRRRFKSGARPAADRLAADCWHPQKILRKTVFGEVQVETHRQNGKSRCVKKINKQAILRPREMLRGPGARDALEKTLRREAELLSGLHHVGIVHMERWDEDESHLYLVMEFLPGGDLLDCIQQHGRFTEPEARRLFTELCEAVAYLHTQDIVHRDLKLENILLTAEKRDQAHLKITDFGISRRAQRSRECRTFCGSLAYTAPEVIRLRRRTAQAATVDAASGVGPGSGEEVSGYGKPADMWSLGVILYIMLSGSPPFENEEEEEWLCAQIEKGRWDFDDEEVWDAVSPMAKDLVLALMAPEPQNRPTIQQACAHRWLQGDASSA